MVSSNELKNFLADAVEEVEPINWRGPLFFTASILVVAVYVTAVAYSSHVAPLLNNLVDALARSM